MAAPAQLSLAFEAGLTARYSTIEDCCAAVVHNYRGGLDGVAPALDMSPSELSRRLNAHLAAKEGDSNNRPLRTGDMVRIIAKTEDFRPVYWLIEKFLRDPEVIRSQAIHELALVMPSVMALVEQATAKGAKR